MFIAHLPAGYLLGSSLRSLKSGWIMTAALAGSIFPDVDLFYFYLVDNRQHNHHSYWSHYPAVWMSFVLLAGIWCLMRKRSKWALAAFVFGVSGMIHIVLDLFVGDIKLFAPFSDRYYTIVPGCIEAAYQPWWLNFILHWSFLVELGIVALGVTVLVRQCKANRRNRNGGAPESP